MVVQVGLVRPAQPFVGQLHQVVVAEEGSHVEHIVGPFGSVYLLQACLEIGIRFVFLAPAYHQLGLHVVVVEVGLVVDALQVAVGALHVVVGQSGAGFEDEGGGGARIERQSIVYRLQGLVHLALRAVVVSYVGQYLRVERGLFGAVLLV